MRQEVPSIWAAFVVALAATGAAVLLRWALDPWLGNDYPYVTLFAAVATAVWYGGARPGLLATLTGLAACVFLFVEPRGSFMLGNPHHIIGFPLIALTCLIIIGFGEAMRSTRRRAEEHQETLRATQHLLARIVESSDDAIIGEDMNGIITSWNHAAERLFGWSAAEMVGRPIAVLEPPERAGETGGILERLGRGERIHQVETVRRARDGRLIPLSLTISPIEDESGKIVGASKMARDMTLRQETEAERERLRRELDAKVQELQAIFDIAPVQIWFGDGECRTFYGNRRAYADHGFEQGINASFNAAVPELPAGLRIEAQGRELKPEDMPMQLAARTRRPVHAFEHDVVHADGRRIAMEASVVPLLGPDGKVHRVVGCYLDVTERKRAQEELRAGAERSAADLEAMALLQQVGARCVEPGRPMQEWLEAVLEAAITLTEADRGTLQLADASGGLIIAAHRGFTRPFLDHFRIVHADMASVCGTALTAGERVIVEDVAVSEIFAGTPSLQVLLGAGVHAVQSTPLISSSGRVMGMVSTHFTQPHRPDDRELRFLDLLVRQAADYLERKNAEDALRESDRRKDEFLATLAHELRNPLAPIRNAAQVLLLKGSPDPELQWSREVIDRQVGHMARLLDDLLDVSRITHNKLELRKERVVLSAVLQSAVETSRPLLDAGRLDFALEPLPGTLHLDADPVRLAQVFSNLLNNAAKFTEAGGHVRLGTRTEDSHVVVWVKDDGTGIAPDILPRVFDLFAQARGAPHRSSGGLGIGLSLAKGLVELHGGTIEIRSEGPGRGTEVLVRLPLAVEEALIGNGAREGPQPAVGRRRLLIVDDLRDSADSLAVLLELLGHDVRTAYGGAEAIRVAREFRPQLILLDIGMPDLDGHDTCRRIRAEPWGKEVLLVALTGWGQHDDRRRTEAAGFDHHIVKPVDSGALANLLATLPR